MSGPDGSAAPAGLSAVKVTGQALAAVTTAGIGAYLGGAVGTVSGAAIASVVTTIGDAFYQRSIERTRDSIKARLRQPQRARVVPGGGEPGTGDRTSVVPGAGDRTSVVPDAAPPATAHLAGAPAAHQRPPAPDESPTQVLSDLDGPATRAASGEEGTRRLGADDPTELAETPAVEKRSSWKRYGVFAATGLLVFLIAMVAVTGIERVKGSPLSGGGPGTSVGSVLGHPTPVTASSSAPPSERSGGSESPTATTASSSVEAPAPTTTSRTQQRGRTPSTTSERPGGGGLLPGGLLPGN